MNAKGRYPNPKVMRPTSDSVSLSSPFTGSRSLTGSQARQYLARTRHLSVSPLHARAGARNSIHSYTFQGLNLPAATNKACIPHWSGAGVWGVRTHACSPQGRIKEIISDRERPGGPFKMDTFPSKRNCFSLVRVDTFGGFLHACSSDCLFVAAAGSDPGQDSRPPPQSSEFEPPNFNPRRNPSH